MGGKTVVCIWRKKTDNSRSQQIHVKMVEELAKREGVEAEVGPETEADDEAEAELRRRLN